MYLKLIFVYKHFSGLLPINFTHYFNAQLTIYNTRQVNYLQYNPSKNNILFFHIFCSGPRAWNLLIKNGFNIEPSSIHSFKKKLKQFLLGKQL